MLLIALLVALGLLGLLSAGGSDLDFERRGLLLAQRRQRLCH